MNVTLTPDQALQQRRQGRARTRRPRQPVTVTYRAPRPAPTDRRTLLLGTVTYRAR